MIGIRSPIIWGKSRILLMNALGKYYTEDNPLISFIIRGEAIMTDKVIMNKKLDELGRAHPKTYYHPFDDLPNTDEACVIKGRYGSRGNHLIFAIFNEVKDFDLYNRYIQDYIPFEREFRVAIIEKRILGIREKLLNEDCVCGKIKNSKSCYYETRKEMPQLEKFAWDVFKQFNIKFTGIDIGLWNGQFIIIELNSAPSIGPDWAKIIANDMIYRYYEVKDDV